jgi:hypothetical protein
MEENGNLAVNARLEAIVPPLFFKLQEHSVKVGWP